MSRLADYFIVVGYDHDKDQNGVSTGKVIQRFPEVDWEHCPYTQGIELFCQPSGWQLHTQRLPPTYFVSVLTDIDGNRHYCACLTFMEDVSSDITGYQHPALRGMDEREEELAGNSGQCLVLSTPEGMVKHSCMFAPKSLVLVSTLDYFDTFRNCLGLIYTVYIDNQQTQLETLIGNILGCIQVPPPGGPQIRFSIGAGDRQALQPPLSNTLPTTRTCVLQLFRALGISNSLHIFCAALSDHKVLFHSESFSRLTDASHALTALMYPLKYSYVYIPLLPSTLFEVLNTPTPFIAGIHSSLKPNFCQLLDVIIADLDGGSIMIPEHIKLSLMPEPMLSRALKSLHMILLPELRHADEAFPPASARKQDDEIIDKEIRAVFLRFFAELFFGYRSCLNIIRIHPEPFITFHKANFLGQRGLVEDDFATRVLDSMCFGTFVGDRGPPYRICDLFDEVFAVMNDTLANENSVEQMMNNVRDLGKQLFANENPNPQPYVQKIPTPTEGSYNRIHQPPFPYLDWIHIQEIIDEGIAKHNIKNKISAMRPLQPRIVPMGHHISVHAQKHCSLSNSTRRLEVLRNCVTFIFDNKISDARKIFPAVLRALKSKVSRLALVEALKVNVQSNRSMLEHQQFDMVVRLLNCALQNDSSMDENGVAAEILPLSTSFCRKLCTGIIQFAYTVIQEHAVWANLQFWEATFYQDVQLQIHKLYSPQYEEQMQLGPSDRQRLGDELSSNSPAGGSIADPDRSPTPRRRSYPNVKHISALEIAAEQMRIWPDLTEASQKELVSNEESIVYSQAIHYANRMVYLRVPLDVTKSHRDSALMPNEAMESSSSNITNSVAESDSFDAESGFEEPEVSEVGANVVKFVTRFVDKVCHDSSVTADHIRALHQMIPGVVAMHIETLDQVCKESKRLPPIQKPKLLLPALLPGEEVLMDGLRVYLVPDGREEATSLTLGGPQLLPAEGAIFLTNYRLVFKGTPCDPLACEQVVSRSFPVSTLTREKKTSAQYLTHIDQWLQECLQLRSNMFQLMKLAFDEEVSSEDIEVLRKLLNKVRHPPSVINTFAFTSYMHPIHTTTAQLKSKHKNASLKTPLVSSEQQFMSPASSRRSYTMGLAKRTLMKTARKAGIKTKEASPVKKYGLPTPPLPRRNLSATLPTNMERPSSVCLDDDELSVIDELESQAEQRHNERTSDRAYCKDYQRLGFGSLASSGVAALTKSRSEPFRLTMVNAGHSLCRSYPLVLVVPQSTTDSSIRKFARCHRQSRFPVVTWRHPTTHAVLLRGSGFHTKGVMGMIKSHHHNTSTASIEASTGQDHEKYFAAVICATPLGGSSSISPGRQAGGGGGISTGGRYTPTSAISGATDSASDSLSSLDSLMMESDSSAHALRQQNALGRAMNSLRSSGGKTKSLARFGGSSLRDRSRFSSPGLYQASLATPTNRQQQQQQRYSMAVTPGHGMDLTSGLAAGSYSSTGIGGISSHIQPLHRKALYVLGEKNQLKGVKTDAFPNCDFIPVECTEVRHVKSSYKKLMRACVPSAPYPDDKGYLKQIEESGWLPLLQNILRIAGAAVDLIDAQGSSVMLCLEDGWDFTTQVSSVAQLLLDPYYRTIEGFKVLIEKEWLSFGHRFTHRSNQTAGNVNTGFAPVFLQFLDVVHQVMHQFPMSFEYNQYFIKFLAYHYISNRFRTFMLDNEYERVELGWLLEEKGGTIRSPVHDSDSEADTSPRQSFMQGLSSLSSPSITSQGYSIWDYIDKYHKRSPIFYNYLYTPLDHDTVLRPYSNLSSLVIWDYYTQEDLAHGPSYDFESVAKEMRELEEQDMHDTSTMMDSNIKKRSIVNACYDNIAHTLPESCTQLLLDIERLTTELGHLNYKWKTTWDRLEQPNREQLIRQMSFNTHMSRSFGCSTHKRSTLELLVRGKLVGETAKMFSQAHHFEKVTYTAPAACDYCSHVIWGLAKTGGMKCTDCGYNVHDKCLSHVPKNCTRHVDTVSDVGASNTTLSKASASETASVSGEHRTHEGYLYKRGALLKAWKQRWFVLDSMKHQLRYYDSSDDSHCKGFIDMAEVVSVNPLKNIQGAPKRANENAAFELKTTKRIYHFLAADLSSAHEWIDKVQSCIQ